MYLQYQLRQIALPSVSSLFWKRSIPVKTENPLILLGHLFGLAPGCHDITSVVSVADIHSQRGGAGGEAPLTGSGERCLGDSVKGTQQTPLSPLSDSAGGEL